MMNRLTVFKKALKLLSLVVGIGFIAYLVTLVRPGAPSRSLSLQFVGYIPLPRTQTVSVLDYISVYGNQLYVTGMSSGSVSKVTPRNSALPTEADVSTMQGTPQTHGVVIDPASHLGFVTRSEENVVDVFDPTTMRMVTSIPVADDPDGIFFDPETKLIYVASGDANMGTIIDPEQRAVAGSIPLGGKPEYASLDTSAHLLYQNLKSTDEVVSIDLKKHSVIDRWKLNGCNGPSGMAIDEHNRRLFIGCSNNAKLAIFTLEDHRVLTTLPVGPDPDSIAFDVTLRRVYSAGKAGVTTVVQQDTLDRYHIADNIHTHYGAHTLTVDPTTHRVYIGYASLFVRPRVAVFDAVQ
jgi:DNA-binding beta-propeller fold protein YncE